MIKHAVWLVLLILCTKGGVWADDLEIFGGQLVNVPPNVLIVFDTSGSMQWCTDPSSNSSCDNVSDRRINVAKSAITQLLDNTQNVNFGLMAFNGSNGGELLEPCGTTPATLKTAVSGLSASGFTPLAETLAEAGLYFAGQRSWFAESTYGNKSWYQNSKYVSPVQEDCQKNYIVLMTDGEPTQDDDSKLASSLYIKNTVIGDYDNDKSGVSCGDGGWGGDTYNDELCELQPDGSYDVYNSQGSDYLDDVAYYLSNKKVFYNSLTTLNTGTDDEIDVTPIRTFTIGFSSPGTVTSLLTNTAANGGGDYYSATTSAALQDAFKEILEKVLDTNAIYATPSIPRNPENQVESGDKTYLAFFKPQPDGRWLGNLKAFGLKDNVLMDSRSSSVTPLAATDADGLIKDTARSYWDVDNANDGLEVAKGGAGEVLTDRITDNGVSDRKVYTYTDVDAVNFLSQGTSFYRLSQQQNQFKTTNVQVLDTLLENIYSSATPPETIVADTLISKVVNGTTVTFDDGTTTKWYLGDIIHSEPSVENFSADCNGDSNPDDDYIFVGANDGMLHAFCAATGKEMWAFIPPSQLGRLNLLGNGEHHYFVDGSPVIAEIAVPNKNTFQKVLIFGEGRGGQRYIALDFTTSDDPTDPHWRYQVHENILNDSSAVLGQSWAKPQFKKIRDVDDITGIETLHDVFLLAGGYDPRYETATFPSSVPQSPEIQGRALYTIDASSGGVVGLNVNGGEWTEMQHSIVDVTGFDAEDRGYIDRVYAGDLGGNLFAGSYNSGTDTWEKLALLALPDNLSFKNSLGNDVNDNSGNPISAVIGKKIMTRPEVTLEPDAECIYFGTGDREHLLDESATDIFYAICHDWEKQIDLDTKKPKFKDGQYLYEPLFPADTNYDGTVDANDSLTDILVDVTDNLIQESLDATQRATIESRLENSAGWYLRMENAGEKITSSPKILDGKIFFTTFTPGQDTQQVQDPCTSSYDLGVSRLYAIDYRTGASVFEFDDSQGLTKADRSTVIGTSVAYDPVLTTSGLKTTLLYGSGGKLKAKDVSLKTILKRYYWRQVK